ncbi:hypothetical protein GCM10022210_05940 [Mucilaginibacter dorajii]|uniref:Uncharacterized protein n=2 Tax=Mucilaginibacter dorajii TaxID=692994 RepID=A0ABP7P7H6_9SPHI
MREDTTVSALDSLYLANSIFEGKLLQAAAKYPFTVSNFFKSFDDEPLGITTSADGVLIIYWWDTLTGGTQHAYSCVAQYKTAHGIKSVSPASPNKYSCSYSKIYSLKSKDKIYYLAVYDEILSYHDRCQGIQIFLIDKDDLMPAKLIKTQTGLHSKIDYLYNDNSMRDQNWENELTYHEKTQTLTIPVALENGNLTDNYITYKFNGEYFIKLKSK